MSHFKILIQHYLRCPLRTAVTARSASTQLSNYTPLLHVMYECMRGSYFSLPRRCPPEAVVKEECELSCRNNWLLSGTSRGRKGRNEGGKEAPSVAVRLRVEGHQASVSVILLTTASPSVQLIGIQSTVGSMGEYWWIGSGGGQALSVSTFTAGWESTGEPASATDTLSLVKWTVTLHFSTCWRRRSGRFEPCDVTLIEFWFSPCCLLLLLLGSYKRSRFNFKCMGPLCKASRLGVGDISIWASFIFSFRGCSIHPRHPSLFHHAASLHCLSASLVFLTAYSHGGVTGARKRKTIKGSHLDPGGNPIEY